MARIYCLLRDRGALGSLQLLHQQKLQPRDWNVMCMLMQSNTVDEVMNFLDASFRG